MSRYLIENEALGILESDDGEEKETSNWKWISTDDVKEDRDEISLCDSSSEEKMDDQPCSSTFANYFISKTETWQTTTFANNAGRAAVHKVIP